MENSVVQQIKDRLDIVEVISGYIKLQKAGVNYRAPCPFHSEKTPSFFVSPARQIWHCFGCGKGGDVFGFVKEIEGMEFGDALRVLAQKAGVELKKQDPKLQTERQRLYEISDLATRFFEKQLQESKIGKTVKEYLLKRGISEKSIKEWRIGYAPEAWQTLSDFLVGRGYKREEIIKVGIAIKKSNYDSYDRFRGRIMFPISDTSGQIIGFTGRVFDEGKEKPVQEGGKYVNTPNTLLYDKSRILYGLDKAKVAIRKNDACILVEGQTDVIMAFQAGFENVVATSGTALTSYQLNILKRYSLNILTAFDMDMAGDSATKRGIELAQAQGFSIKVVAMPDGEDPADIISKKPKAFKKLIDQARSILEFYFETTFFRFDEKKPENKSKIAEILLPVIKKIPNKIEQSHWIQKLSGQLEVSEESIREELKKTKKEIAEAVSKEKIAPAPKTRKEMLEEKIISLILKFPAHMSVIKNDYLDCFSDSTKEIIIKLKEQKVDKNMPLEKMLKENFSEKEIDFLNYLYLKADIEIEGDNIKPLEEIDVCLMEIQTLKIKAKLNRLSKQIKQEEELKNFKKANALVEEFNKLSQNLK